MPLATISICNHAPVAASGVAPSKTLCAPRASGAWKLNPPIEPTSPRPPRRSFWRPVSGPPNPSGAWNVGALVLAVGWAIHRIASPWWQPDYGLLCLVGIPIAGRLAAMAGRKDPGSIVLDEIASMPIVFGADAVEVSRPIVLAAGFVLHRILDISKPPPAWQLEHLPTGMGIMADDWAAAADG